jgi:hypothetical protein
MARRIAASATVVSDPAQGSGSPATVRYHLKTAFAHTGVRTQSRLVQRVTRALTEFGVRG